MVWFQVNIPLVVGCLLMAALMDLRLFKLCLLVASILLMFLAAGVMVFGTKQGFIPANAVAVLSVMVWFGCVISVIFRWLRSRRPFASKADHAATCERALSGGTWMLDPTAGRLTSQIAPEFHFNNLISGPSGSTLYGVVLEKGVGTDESTLSDSMNEMGGFSPGSGFRTPHPADRDWAPHRDPYRRWSTHAQ
jgi:hypothetical protein